MSIFLHSFLGWTEREVGDIPQGNLRQICGKLCGKSVAQTQAEALS
jgi:hypothetical protein